MKYLASLIERYPSLAPCADDIESAYKLFVDSYRAGGKLLILGNGGSASDALHIVGELMKGFMLKRPVKNEALGELAGLLQGSLPAIALTGSDALTSAVLNDLDPAVVYAQQVWGLGKPGDVLLSISTSGNAKNAHYAIIAAKALGMKTVALTGAKGGLIAPECDVAVKVPERETYLVQELHLPVYHAWCSSIEAEFFAE